MKRYTLLTCISCLITTIGFTQSDTTTIKATADIFNRIAAGVKEYQLDTTAAPNDKMTKQIRVLRDLRGGFNINEAIAFKIEEDRQKKELPEAELEKLATFFQTGNGKKWLDNATIWIYRNHFTYKELKQLVKFYKTSGGQKMATHFPILMLQSLTAAEKIKELYAQQQKTSSK